MTPRRRSPQLITCHQTHAGTTPLMTMTPSGQIWPWVKARSPLWQSPRKNLLPNPASSLRTMRGGSRSRSRQRPPRQNPISPNQQLNMHQGQKSQPTHSRDRNQEISPIDDADRTSAPCAVSSSRSTIDSLLSCLACIRFPIQNFLHSV